MAVDYEIIVKGNNLRLADGFLGMTNLTLIKTNDGYMLVDVGHTVNRQGLVRALKERGLNPGTSADLTVATLFVAALQDLEKAG